MILDLLLQRTECNAHRSQSQHLGDNRLSVNLLSVRTSPHITPSLYVRA